MAANLTSPTNEFATATKERSNSGDDKLDKKVEVGGSIVGLRPTTKFSNLEKKASPSPEAKPRTAATSTTSTGMPISNVDENVSNVLGPKPKPLPKPRPWSIVGVDRKSGEMTSVCDKAGDKIGANPTPPAPAKGSVRDLINNMNKETTTNDKRKGSSLPRGTHPPGDHIPCESANSPKMSKKTECNTSDDPRILKLEDDYAYEGVLDV